MVWVMLFQRGRARVRSLPQSWHRTRSWWVRNIAAYAVLGVLTAVLVGMVTSGNRAGVPIRHFPDVICALTAPASGIPSESLLAARQRLEISLGIGNRLLRRPITVLSILAPPATSVLTAFLSP